jgi:hypothetical protein
MTGMNAFTLVFFLFLILVFLFTMARPVYCQSRWLHVFRVFFPSWKFFDEVGEIATLRYRFEAKENEWSEWLNFPTKTKMKWYFLFFNPQVNFHLAGQSAVQILGEMSMEHAGSAKDFFQLQEYRIVQNLVAYVIVEERKLERFGYQFKIEVEQGDILVSPNYRQE